MKVALCRAPRIDEDLDAWVRAVAAYAEVDPAALRALALRLVESG